MFIWVVTALLIAAAIAVGIWPRRRRARKENLREKRLVQYREKEKAREAEQWRRQLRQLPFPYSLVRGSEAQSAFEAASAESQANTSAPLIITPATLLFPDLASHRDQTLRILNAPVPASIFFEQRRARLEGDEKQFLDDLASPGLSEPHSAKPEFSSRMKTLMRIQPSGPTFYDEVALVRIPASRSWEIPAHILYGGWNDCPTPEEIVGVAKLWNDSYGAEICGVGNGTLEFRVERPPTNLAEAARVLQQHILFCSEGFADLMAEPEFARISVTALQSETYWLFWWD